MKLLCTSHLQSLKKLCLDRSKAKSKQVDNITGIIKPFDF
jgi:hypothetical protein